MAATDAELLTLEAIDREPELALERRGLLDELTLSSFDSACLETCLL